MYGGLDGILVEFQSESLVVFQVQYFCQFSLCELVESIKFSCYAYVVVSISCW
jgi:hypothetical protein